MSGVGHHVLLDLFDCACQDDLLIKLENGIGVMAQCCKLMNIIGEVRHQFEPYSYSIVVALKESHCSIHTWYEKRFVSADFYTCNGRIPECAVAYLIHTMDPKRVSRIDVSRGSIPAESEIREYFR